VSRLTLRCALALATVGVAGCGSANGWAPVQVHDERSVLRLDKAALESLGRAGQALGATFVVVTAPDVDVRALAVSGDRASEKLDEGRFWPSRKAFPRSARAITFFYTERPRLLQIRYGRTFRHRARLAAIDYGPEYAALQRMARADGEPDLVTISERIAQELSAVKLPFYRAWTLWLVSILDDEMLPFLTMPVFEMWNGMASLVAVHIYNGLGRLTSGYFTFAAALVAVVFLPFVLFSRVFASFSTTVVGEDGPVQMANGPVGCLMVLAFMAFMAVAIFPQFGLLVLSANQRTEDLMMLQAMSVETSLVVPADLRWYVVLVLAIVTVAGRLPPKLLAPDGADDPGTVLETAKQIFVVPIVFFILPAWTVVLITYAFVIPALMVIVVALTARRRGSPANAQHDPSNDVTV
jgi:hypothetical protein